MFRRHTNSDDDPKIVTSLKNHDHPYVALAAIFWRGLPKVVTAVAYVALAVTGLVVASSHPSSAVSSVVKLITTQ